MLKFNYAVSFSMELHTPQTLPLMLGNAFLWWQSNTFANTL